MLLYLELEDLISAAVRSDVSQAQVKATSMTSQADKGLEDDAKCNVGYSEPPAAPNCRKS